MEAAAKGKPIPEAPQLEGMPVAPRRAVPAENVEAQDWQASMDALNQAAQADIAKGRQELAKHIVIKQATEQVKSGGGAAAGVGGAGGGGGGGQQPSQRQTTIIQQPQPDISTGYMLPAHMR